MQYFNYCTGLTMTNARFDELFGGPPRRAESPVTQREMDIAASIQAVTEEVVLRLARTLHAGDGRGEPLPRRRRGAQLRRQRPHPARRALQTHLDPAGRRATPAAPSARPRSPGTNTAAPSAPSTATTP